MGSCNFVWMFTSLDYACAAVVLLVAFSFLLYLFLPFSRPTPASAFTRSLPSHHRSNNRKSKHKPRCFYGWIEAAEEMDINLS